MGGASHTLDTGSDKGNLHAIVSILNTQSMQLVTVCNSLVPRQHENKVKCMPYRYTCRSFESDLLKNSYPVLLPEVNG